MAFTCTAQTKGPHPEPVCNGEGYSVSVPLGYDDHEGCDYTLIVALDPLPGEGYQFMFFIVMSDVITEEEELIWSGLSMSRKANKYDRCVIMECLLSVSEYLITYIEPKRFAMVTHDENLPDEALVKFRRLNDIFTKSGYAVSEGECQYGTHFWRMERG